MTTEGRSYTAAMRILMCAQQAPLPPPDGFRLYLAALLRELTVDHDVRVLAFRTAAQKDDPNADWDMRLLSLPARRSLPWFWYIAKSLMRSALLGRPMRVDEQARRLRRPLAEEISRFQPDVIHVATGSLAAVADYLGGRPSVLAALDAWHLNVEAWAREARGVRRRILMSEANRVRNFEGREFPRYDKVVVVTEQDREALESLGANLDVVAIPNGVDVAKFTPRRSNRVPGRILFTGVMSYAPNVSAAQYLARDVLPQVRDSVPAAHLQIVGRRPNPAVRALDRLDGVEIVGEVPDMEPYLSAASVYACPMVSGTGIKNKLLEAMANRLPCVATSLALQGLGARPGRDVLVADDAPGFADGLRRLVADGDLAAAVGGAGADYVERNHSWAAVARRYLEVYEEVARRSPTGPAASG